PDRRPSQTPALGQNLKEILRDALEHQSWQPFLFISLLMRPAGRRMQMFDRAGIVAQYVPLADAEPSALGDDDASRLERFGRFFNRLLAAGDAEVRVARRQLT